MKWKDSINYQKKNFKMKIEKVIFTIDNNPHYKGFWKSISKHYKTRLNMDCKLFIIGDNVDVNDYDDTYGELESVDLVKGVPSIIQALIGKFYFTITEPETIWKIGDLDLYPLQKSHFTDSIENISDDMYIHLNPHAYGINWRQSFEGLAGYYHVAKGKVFEEALKFKNKSFSDVVNEIYKSKMWGIKFHGIVPNNANKQASDFWGWFCCEEMYTGDLLKNYNKLVEIPPSLGEYNRIDRSHMKYNLDLISQNYYIDLHSPRPYEHHKEEIENIISHVK